MFAVHVAELYSKEGNPIEVAEPSLYTGVPTPWTRRRILVTMSHWRQKEQFPWGWGWGVG